jgi:hypothetical protein
MKIALFAAALACLSLAACNPAPTSAELGQDDPNAPETAAVDTKPRLYDAMSRTAESFTGGLEFHDQARAGPNAAPSMQIIAEMGHEWDVTWVQDQNGADTVAGRPWVTLLPIAADAPVNIYAVEKETVKAGTLNGGLCAPAATKFMVFSEGGNASGERQLSVAAFSDEAWPPKGVSGLCGTFTYVLRQDPAPGAQ